MTTPERSYSWTYINHQLHKFWTAWYGWVWFAFVIWAGLMALSSMRHAWNNEWGWMILQQAAGLISWDNAKKAKERWLQNPADDKCSTS